MLLSNVGIPDLYLCLRWPLTGIKFTAARCSPIGGIRGMRGKGTNYLLNDKEF